MIARYSKRKSACVRSLFINRLPIKKGKTPCRSQGKQERVIRQALDHWQQSGELSAQQHQQLESTLQRLPLIGKD